MTDEEQENYNFSDDIKPCNGNKRMDKTDDVYKMRKSSVKNLEKIVPLDYILLLL